MKKFIVIFGLLAGLGVWASATEYPAMLSGTPSNANYIYNYTLSVSSVPASYSTITAQSNGMQRIISNNSSVKLYIKKSNAINIDTLGIIVPANSAYIESVWFGAMYLQAEAGSSDIDVRVETIGQ